MMKSLKIGFGLSGLLLLTLLAACSRPEPFDVEPHISFSSLEYRVGEANRDSLILTINFTDGDGDLGLDDSDRYTSPPYHPFNFVVDQEGALVTLRKIRNATTPFNVFIRDRAMNNSSVPFGTSADAPPFIINGRVNEQDYIQPNFVSFTGDTVKTDTAYIHLNENFYNIYIDFLVQQPNGEFAEFDLIEKFGVSFDGRFPILNDPVRSIEGTLTYRMVSAFRIVPELRNNNVKLRVQIRDRSLNPSNIIETEIFDIP